MSQLTLLLSHVSPKLELAPILQQTRASSLKRPHACAWVQPGMNACMLAVVLLWGRCSPPGLQPARASMVELQQLMQGMLSGEDSTCGHKYGEMRLLATALTWCL